MSVTGATDPMIKRAAHVWLTPKDSLFDFSSRLGMGQIVNAEIISDLSTLLIAS
jgi:hypothetical protein